ncbi:GNAT family N-acetyltransferase [Oceanicola sp. D3]|uniref:GNAT family N-acetyltransferase n=1 Tax=Oceanicola sp. D3 TaxID=2587163 RepID=UPI00111FBD34|nr:GNAT family N-acetyltransferase [Oceanicola sp. D3]QDC08457.1 GNAT family N-acetyltransferase [Oceanicola sp. D3]
MSSITIRDARAADVEAIATNHRATHAEHRARIDGYDDAPWDEQITGHLTDPSQNPHGFTVLVAELGGHFAGHIALHPFEHNKAGPVSHISDISVRAGDRGYGVGRSLVAAAEGRVAQQGGHGVVALIWPGNTISRAFFTTMGYATQLDKKERHVVAYKDLRDMPAPSNIDRFALIGAMCFLAFIVAALSFGWFSGGDLPSYFPR